MDAPLQDDLAIDILQYMVENPDARDEAEGILAWWFSRERIRAGLTRLELVLDELVARDLVVEYHLPGERTAYSVNKNRINDIVQLIREQTR